MAFSPRILVAEGNTRQRNEKLVAMGARTGSGCYQQAIKFLFPSADVDILAAADLDTSMPDGKGLADYDGFVMGGSGLNIPGGDDDPHVRQQIELGKAVFEAGVPFLGSCWGLQIAAVATGGQIGVSPRGRELGIARKITVTPEGRGCGFFEGKSTVFDSPAIHFDEVTHLPTGSVALATNGHTSVQAASIKHKGGTFWGVQYHPEFDMAHMADLICSYTAPLVSEGFFADTEAAIAYAAQLDTLHQNPSRQDLGWMLGIDQDVLDPRIRFREIENWVTHQVLPRTTQRLAQSG
jgi:GMP synthase (glutamine-hydrolysing)